MKTFMWVAINGTAVLLWRQDVWRERDAVTILAMKIYIIYIKDIYSLKVASVFIHYCLPFAKGIPFDHFYRFL